MQNWLLPEHIEDILPPDAQRIETLRRRLLDLFQSHGFELIIPPMLEYVQSLLTGTGYDLDLKTFKVVDQASGRLLGLRADISPQVARIDAHLLNRRGVARLCYAGSVLHTAPEGILQTREPLQIGAEIFGHAGIESDIEIQRLLLEALAVADVGPVYMDIGHVSIFRHLVAYAELPRSVETALFEALQTKDVPAIQELAAPLPAAACQAFLALPELSGGKEVLARAREVLPDIAGIREALDQLEQVAVQLEDHVGNLCFDLAELRGYHYHSGIVFAAYVAGWPQPLARGGRYDEVGKAFGRARPATGFSMDLRALAAGLPKADRQPAILAPFTDDPQLDEAIRQLRAAGEIVILDLPGHDADRHELGCNRQLVLRQGHWQVVTL